MTCIYGSPSRPGPEARLVQQFIETCVHAAPEGLSRTVFIEPTLKSSRPDIVVVDWDVLIAQDWPVERRFVQQFDLRLVQLLLREGPLSEHELRLFFPRRLKQVLGRLESAHMVQYRNREWVLQDLETIFAPRQIATFEAKISALSKAVKQAFLNTWFASESYVLTADRSPTDQIVDKARSRGVGLWFLPTGRAYLGAERHSLPRSYASWFFNELVWRRWLGVLDGCEA